MDVSRLPGRFWAILPAIALRHRLVELKGIRLVPVIDRTYILCIVARAVTLLATFEISGNDCLFRLERPHKAFERCSENMSMSRRPSLLVSRWKVDLVRLHSHPWNASGTSMTLLIEDSYPCVLRTSIYPVEQTSGKRSGMIV